MRSLPGSLSRSLIMDVDRGDERYRRPSAASFEGIVFYVDDFSAATTTGRDPSSKMYDRPEDVYELSVASDESRAIPQPSGPDSFGLQPENRSALYPAYLPGERACCQTSGPRRSRSNLDVDQRSSRRSSVQSSRSRANSCSGRPTPLGNETFVIQMLTSPTAGLSLSRISRLPKSAKYRSRIISTSCRATGSPFYPGAFSRVFPRDVDPFRRALERATSRIYTVGMKCE